jgi:hypothetical protein
MKWCRIRDRNKVVWRYVPKRHKTSHRGKQRHVPFRKAKDGVIPMEPRKPSPRVGRMFKKGAINRAVNRAIVKANKARAEQGLEPLPYWTPYQLSYTRLREIRKRGWQEAAQATAGHSSATMTQFAAKHG